MISRANVSFAAVNRATTTLPLATSSRRRKNGAAAGGCGGSPPADSPEGGFAAPEAMRARRRRAPLARPNGAERVRSKGPLSVDLAHDGVDRRDHRDAV